MTERMIGKQRLILGDTHEVLPTLITEEKRFGVIATDPPYARATLPLYELLLKYSGKLLSDGGSLLSIIPHFAIPELGVMPCPGLKWRWLCWMNQSEGNYPRMVNGKRTIMVTGKPIGWWTREPWADDFNLARDFRTVRDSFENSPPSKEQHPWAQSEDWAQYCLTFLSASPNDGVLDPYLGTGTTLKLAQRLGIAGTGVEIDEETYEIACANIEEEMQL